MSRFRQDPGDCPICGAAHCACTSDSGPITIAQLPMRDAAAAQALTQGGPPSSVPPAAADPAPEALGDRSDDRPFSTGTYRGKKRRR